jgi:hypothetical protein
MAVTPRPYGMSRLHYGFDRFIRNTSIVILYYSAYIYKRDNSQRVRIGVRRLGLESKGRGVRARGLRIRISSFSIFHLKLVFKM